MSDLTAPLPPSGDDSRARPLADQKSEIAHLQNLLDTLPEDLGLGTLGVEFAPAWRAAVRQHIECVRRELGAEETEDTQPDRSN
ncbi:hypothetical protein [Nocardia camponoti]|uniref:Uncharacterized protein n=1 Tax=Nocardia camponoti TaxID=1616106 RepID=A0A917VCM0_9NOCA|nr:hypothetical protein [Nocardia camponoti]GGK63054.1 hypothetical protein GCM10011591_39160 [Nocardia camponoti]